MQGLGNPSRVQEERTCHVDKPTYSGWSDDRMEVPKLEDPNFLQNDYAMM